MILIVWFFLLFLMPLSAQQEERLSGTALEALHRKALIRILKEQNITFEERPLFAEYGGFGSSIHIVIPQSIEPETAETLVLGIPLVSAEEVKNRSPEMPFGVEIGLAFIRDIRNKAFPFTIRVAFLGDEVSSLPADQRKSSHKGLEDLYSVLEEPENTVLLYLDIPEAPRSLLIHHGTPKAITPLSVLEPLHRLCVSHKIPYSLAVRFNELYKLNLVKGHPIIESAQSRLVNALYITGSKDNDSQNSTAEDIAAMLADYAGSLTISAENFDYHFLILPFLKYYIFISESITIKIFIGLFSISLFIILIYFVVYRKKLIILWYIFLLYIWIFLLFLFSLVSALEIAGAVIALIGNIFKVSYFTNDFGWAGFKITTALLLFSLLFSLCNLIKIPKKADFYGNAAVLLVILGVIISTALDITFTPVFMCICLVTLLGAVLKKPIFVFICAFIIPVQTFRPFLNILKIHSSGYSTEYLVLAGRLSEILLSQNILSSLYLAVIALPLILLFERGVALIQGKTQSPLSRRRITCVLALLLVNLGSLIFYTYGLAKNLPAPPVRRVVDETGVMTDILTIKLDYVTFLERRSIEVYLEAKGNPLCFNLYLDSPKPVIYNAPMPSVITDDWKSLALILGEGPPNPFTTDIVLPLDVVGSLRVEALYTAWDPAVDTMPPPESDDYVLRVIKTIPLPASCLEDCSVRQVP